MEAVVVVVLALLVPAAIALWVVKTHLIVVSPNEVAVISGRKRHRADGSVVGYRLVRGGRVVRIPFLEEVALLDLSNLPVTAKLRGLHTTRGKVDLEYVANVKIAGHEPLVHNAVERFLGQSREQLARVAAQTLEGILREVAARLDPDAFRDTERVAAILHEESDRDLSKLGLVLDSIKVTAEGVAGSARESAPDPGPSPIPAPAPERAVEAPANAEPASTLDGDLPPWARGGG
jgi:flotillin